MMTMLGLSMLLGLRHGFDLDHLATIDAMTRMSAKSDKASRLVGFYFSLGHGLFVLMVSLIIGFGAALTQVPEWLEWTGLFISSFFLLLFGAVNLYWFIWPQTQSHTHHAYQKFLEKRVSSFIHPLGIMLVGSLFALSFDTISQIALFGLSINVAQHIWPLLGLSLAFTLGMIVADGLNGVLVARLFNKGSTSSRRLLGGAIALFSFAVAWSNLYPAFYAVFFPE